MIRLTLVLVLLTGCSLLGDLTGGSGVQGSAEVTQAEEVIVNNGLDFWHWMLIGMFIPSPIDILKDFVRGWRS